jgi:aspartyl-tRNA(Asn)/glutamyl-tRNA(Gln) amidotransferase subunit A
MPILFAEASYCHRQWLDERRDEYSSGVLERLDAGRRLSAVEYLSAMAERDRIRSSLRQRQQSTDVLLMPTTASVAWPIDATDIPVADDEQNLKSIICFTAPFDLTGSPALSIPCGFTHAGLPIGLQIVGRPFDEHLVLRSGHAYQQVTDWHCRVPPCSAAERLPWPTASA